MSTFIAVCPYCRVGGVRAPRTAIGASATCPKCKCHFTLVPEETLPAWAKTGADAPSPAPGRAEPKPAPVDETYEQAALPDVTEPSPVVPAAEPARRPAPPPAVSASDAIPTGAALVVALGAVILVGPAVVASQFSYGRGIGLVLAGAGLLGGGACLGAEGRARLVAAGAVVLHSLVLGVLLFLPAWLGLSAWRDPATAAERPTGPVAVSTRGESARLAPGEWLDASAASWQGDDVRVSVRGATVGPVELTGPRGTKRTTRELLLRVTVRVRNANPDRELVLSGWAAGQGPVGLSVRDPSDKPIALARFEAGWAPDPGKPTERVLPGHTSEVVFVFADPGPRAEFVRVQLPGRPVGSPDDVRFRAALTRTAARP